MTNRKARILVIEDDVLLSESIATLLECEGFTVEEAGDGVEGLEKITRSPPDLILCDVMMPRMNGYQLKETLQSKEIQKSNPGIAMIPFIFLTAAASSDQRRQGMNLGATDYITKPYTRHDVLAAIETRLELAENVRQLIETRTKAVRQEMLKEIPDKFGNLLNDIMGVFQLLKDEVDEAERQQLIGDGLRVSGEFYGVLWAYFKQIGRSKR